MRETIIELKEVPRRDTWVLWEIEDRLAERVSHVFCAPSVGVAEKQFNEAKEKQGAKDGEMHMRIIAMYVAGELKAAL